MERVTVRRCLSIGNYETVTIESAAEAETAEKARVLASKKVLELLKQELICTFGIGGQNLLSNPWDLVTMELSGIDQELSHLNH